MGENDNATSETQRGTESLSALSTLDVVPVLDEGQRLAGRFRIERSLGRGSFGQVYRAHDELLDRTVAVKVLLPRRGSQAAAEERLLGEARTIAKLDHPHIVPLYDAGLLEGHLWMAMRLVQGRSLAALLKEEGRLPPARALRCLRQAVAALEHAHVRGVVHRDVKPSNILVEKRENAAEHVWLLDFGIARAFTGETALADRVVAGTPSYMAPEQISGRRVDPRSDLFAVGCIACELVTGVRAFGGATFSEVLLKVVHEPARGLDTLDALAGAGYAGCVRRALAKSPDDRHASATEMLAELNALEGGKAAARGVGFKGFLQRALRPRTRVGWDGRHAVVAEGVAKWYRPGRPVLKALDLRVPTGSIYALLGSNGAGKTTFLRTVLGLYAPDAGHVRVLGRDPGRHRKALLARVGYVPEVLAAYPWMRVRDVLDLLRRLYPTWDKAYCYQLLARFDLPLDTRLRDLSRGLQTKVSLVSALGHRPELLVLDDPTLGLDAVVLTEFFETLSEASEREGTSVLVSSHHLEELERVASHVAFLKEGRLLHAGPLDDLRQSARCVELVFKSPVHEVPPVAGFRRLHSAPHRLTGITIDPSSGALARLEMLGAEQITTRAPTLKEIFVGIVGHDAGGPRA